MSFANSEAEDDTSKAMLLEISEPKGALFAADQTPTPTRLIKNCEEVGLFDDLQHVNPFDETFRRAVEQKQACTSCAPTQPDNEDTLHTPQVFPQLEQQDGAGVFHTNDLLEKPLGRFMSIDDILVDGIAMPYKIASRQNSGSSTASNASTGRASKQRPIAAEKTAIPSEQIATSVIASNAVQLIQPQIITWNFSATDANDALQSRPILNTATAIPIQTVKPFILPKPTISASSENSIKQLNCPAVATASTLSRTTMQQTPSIEPTTPTANEPSSASLTPTSQLPIKERLKAILSNSSKSRIIELPQKLNVKHTSHSTKDCNERRRAASTRYRNKIRNEHKELRRRNTELMAENEKLRQRVQQLEKELHNQQQQQLLKGVTDKGVNVPAHIQLPPSTLHLVMNIPRILVPSMGQPTLQQPITYAMEKK